MSQQPANTAALDGRFSQGSSSKGEKKLSHQGNMLMPSSHSSVDSQGATPSLDRVEASSCHRARPHPTRRASPRHLQENEMNQAPEHIFSP